MAQEPSDQLARQLREAWFRFVDTIEPIRPRLHQYCRRLTRNVWDAEDLLQETLVRAFPAVVRGEKWGSPRAYLFRIATNTWIDEIRRAETRQANELEGERMTPSKDSLATRDAAARLIERTSPQERAAVLLKDVFDFSIEDVADLLSTTGGAIKAALHRGRQRLQETGDIARPNPRGPSKELLDKFVAAFEARDVNAITGLLLENVTLEVPGVGGERGKSMVWIHSSLDVPTPNNPNPPQRNWVSETVQYQGEWIVAIWQAPRSASVLAGVNRFEEVEGRIARIWEYHFCPDTIAEVAAALGAKAMNHGYRHSPEVLANVIASAVLPWELEEIGNRRN
ncbi:MAG TPA: sigma-70 family RNA polymerase sigma factor [Candidatus Binataceae bacterium]|nr:sigma-70 family RNA polymerase sigma factor [Candidatus Binataceae bacterium]